MIISCTNISVAVSIPPSNAHLIALSILSPLTFVIFRRSTLL